MRKIVQNWFVRPLKVVAYVAAALVLLAVSVFIVPVLFVGSIAAFFVGAIVSDVYDKNLMDI